MESKSKSHLRVPPPKVPGLNQKMQVNFGSFFSKWDDINGVILYVCELDSSLL